MDRRCQKYTLALVFTKDLSRVLLLEKKTPAWQAGRYNGPGGKYESGETARACIAREVFEETALVIKESAWMYVGTIKQEAGDVGVLTARYEGDAANAVTTGEEEVGWYDVSALPESVMDNLRWIVPLAREVLQGRRTAFQAGSSEGALGGAA